MTNKERIQKMFEEFANTDKKAGMAAILAMMSDDIVWTTQGPADVIPFAGVHKGKDGVVAMFETEAKVLQPANFLAEPVFIGADNESTQVFYMSAESVKLAAAPHNEYNTPFAMFFTFNEAGLIIAANSVYDTYAVAKAFTS